MSKRKSNKCGVFGCPVQKLVFDTWEDIDKHKAIINKQFFTHAVSVLLPCN